MIKKRATRLEKFKNYSLEEREVYADYLRERVYSTITLLAVVSSLYAHNETYTAHSTFLIVLGTVGALWLADKVADHMSQRIIHGNTEATSAKKLGGRIRNPSTGLLEPALAPLLFIGFAALGWIDLDTALFVSVGLLVMSMALFSVLYGRRTSHNIWHIIVYSGAQLLIGLCVVLLKIGLK